MWTTFTDPDTTVLQKGDLLGLPDLLDGGADLDSVESWGVHEIREGKKVASKVQFWAGYTLGEARTMGRILNLVLYRKVDGAYERMADMDQAPMAETPLRPTILEPEPPLPIWTCISRADAQIVAGDVYGLPNLTRVQVSYCASTTEIGSFMKRRIFGCLLEKDLTGVKLDILRQETKMPLAVLYRQVGKRVEDDPVDPIAVPPPARWNCTDNLGTVLHEGDVITLGQTVDPHSITEDHSAARYMKGETLGFIVVHNGWKGKKLSFVREYTSKANSVVWRRAQDIKWLYTNDPDMVLLTGDVIARNADVNPDTINVRHSTMAFEDPARLSPGFVIYGWGGKTLAQVRAEVRRPDAVAFKKLDRAVKDEVPYPLPLRDKASSGYSYSTHKLKPRSEPISYLWTAEPDIIMKDGDIVGSIDAQPSKVRVVTQSIHKLCISKVDAIFVPFPWIGKPFSIARAKVLTLRGDINLVVWQRQPDRRKKGSSWDFSGLGRDRFSGIGRYEEAPQDQVPAHWVQLTDPSTVLQSGDVLLDKDYVPHDPANMDRFDEDRGWVVVEPGAAGELYKEYTPQALYRKIPGKRVLLGNAHHSEVAPLP